MMTSALRAVCTAAAISFWFDRRRHELHFVARPAAAFGQAHAFGIIDGEAAFAGFLHPFEHADDVLGNVAVAADGSVARVRPDHRHAADLRRIERQQLLVVPEQDDRLVRGFASERDRIGSRRFRFGAGDVGIGILEQPRFELQPQHPAHGVIDQRLRNAALADQLGEMDVRLADRASRRLLPT